MILVLAIGASAQAQEVEGGSASIAIIRRVMHRSAPALRACYAARLRERPDLAGRWDVHLVIEPGGSVTSARVVPAGTQAQVLEQARPSRGGASAEREPEGAAPVSDPELEACTVRVLDRHRFPSLGPGEVRVRWTFEYVPTPAAPSDGPPRVRLDDRGPFVIRAE